VYTASRPGALVYVARNEMKSRGYTIGENDEDEDENENRGAGEEDSTDHDWVSRNSPVAVTLTHGPRYLLFLRPEIPILVLFFNQVYS
jgi:hypothetical protein